MGNTAFSTIMRFQNPLTSISFLFAIVAILAFSQVADAKACSNGLTLCESGSVGCNGNYCTVKARGQTRYFCPPASNNCPGTCIDFLSGSTSPPRCSTFGSGSGSGTTAPTQPQPAPVQCTWLRRLFRLC